MKIADQPDHRDFFYYNQIRRCSPDRFYEPVLQKKMREDCLALGHEAFFETERTLGG